VAGESGVETVVLDNASHDGSAAAVAEHYPQVRLLALDDNLGFAAGVNRAAAAATGGALLVLNADARMEPGSLVALADFLDAHPRAALVAPALRYPDGRPQSAAFRFPGLTQVLLDLFPVDRLAETPINGRVHLTEPAQIDHPLGACMLIRRTAWQHVGPLDEGYFMYLEEVDWCQRARSRGWQVWQQPHAVAIHHGGAATRQQPDAMYAQLWRSRLRYYQRFGGPLSNWLIRRIVRVGLSRRRSASVDRVRDLVR
jgi:N-acetylglucosaminyl-diphospho-decaprenol L-rhamnosyltransferase